MVRVFLFIALLPPTALASEPKPLPAPKTDATPVAVTWTEIESAFGCFFFCGPGDLGRDLKLGKRARLSREGNFLTLEFDKKVRFRGRLDGKKVRLERQSSHQFNGTWQILQMIEGTFTDGSVSGDYSYSECDTSGSEGCPGRCTIRAHVEIHPAERPARPSDRVIAQAVTACVGTGRQHDRAFARAGTVTVRWRAGKEGALVEIGFWENSFARLSVSVQEIFDACVERRMRAAPTRWNGTGSFTVTVSAP